MMKHESNLILVHHGILGMHWGIRRYQPYPNGKFVGKKVAKRNNKVEKRRQKIAKERSKKEKKEALAEERKRKIELSIEEGKRKAIASGNLNEILKNKEKMSNDELRQAIERTKLLNQIKEMSASDVQKAKNNFNNSVDKSKKKKKEKMGDKIYNQIDKSSKRLGTTLKLINTVIALGTVLNKVNKGKNSTKKTEKTMDDILKNLDVTLNDYHKNKS